MCFLFIVFFFCILLLLFFFFFFFNDTATTEIYTLSLHDALPICRRRGPHRGAGAQARRIAGHILLCRGRFLRYLLVDRKSTRLNSSHSQISYAVFCLKKKKKTQTAQHRITKKSQRTMRITDVPIY